jgi:hypothetical protein
MLAASGPLEGVRAFIAAAHGLDLLCVLIRHGCPAAICLKPGMRADRGEHDLVLIPNVEDADEAIRTARRALTQFGRVVMGVEETDGRRSIALSRRLRLNGFRSVRTRAFPGYTIVIAQSNGRLA